MLITSFYFDSYLKCTTKCWLYSQGKSGSGTIYSEWIRSRNEQYRKEGIIRLLDGVDPVKVTMKSSKQLCQDGNWQIAIEVLALTRNLKSCIDAIEQIPSETKGDARQLVPIRFVPLNKVTSEHKQGLAFDAWVLSEMLGHEITVGRIIHGDNHDTLAVNVAPMFRDIQKVTTKVTALLSSSSPPELVLNKHCAECEFQQMCRQQAIEKDDLSLLAGMTEKLRRKLNSKGIFAITPLSYTFRARRRSKRLIKKPEKYYDSLKALAIRERKTYIVGSPQLKIDGTPIYLDVESIPDRDFYYLIGVFFHTAECQIQYSFWANTKEEEQKIWTEFIDILSAVDNPVLIHYGSFETVFLRRMCQRYGEPLEESKLAKAIKSSINLLKIIFARIYFPTFSNGLKEIASSLGFSWSDPSLFGLNSIAFRCDWEQSHDSSIKQKLLLYNIEDCKALELVTLAVDTLCRGASPEKQNPEDTVVYTDRLKPPKLHYLINQGGAALPEFVDINKAAYWDYQRHRVYVRSSRTIKKACKKESKCWEKMLRARSTIRHPDPTSCPHCENSALVEKNKTDMLVYDIRFTQSGAKGWVTRHIRNNWYCNKCGALVRVQGEESTSLRKYGHNLRAYAVNQLIHLKMSQTKVAELLTELFGFNLNGSHISSFKSELANFHADSVQELINCIVKGPLINADETKVESNRPLIDSLTDEKDKKTKMLQKSGYIWILANLEEVVYLYNETREGKMVQGLLKNFHGVLVSDFYPVYDSISCPQQKCLIHLMRDINDDLHKHPYDNDLRKVAQEFTNVLKHIVETIDKHGLKAYFLAKHIPSVEKLFNLLSDTDFVSETAEGYRKRFLKNRDKLFTFLTHDNVPWNNNNAENAVHAFAELRTVIHGTWSEKGLREYLVLFSLCETCKRRGLSFLDFLLSRERSIDQFAKKKRRYNRRSQQQRKEHSSDVSSKISSYNIAHIAPKSTRTQHSQVNMQGQHNDISQCFDGEESIDQGSSSIDENHTKEQSMRRRYTPLFPQDITEITTNLTVSKNEGQVMYYQNELPVFIHAENDMASFRMITSQFCVSGRVKQIQIARTFGIPQVSVKRAVKRYREYGPRGFYAVRKTRGASVLTEPVMIEVQLLLDAGLTVKKVAERMGLKRDTLLKAVRAGKLHVIK